MDSSLSINAAINDVENIIPQRIKVLWSAGALGVAFMMNTVAGFVLVYMVTVLKICLLYTSPSPRDRTRSRMPSSA